MKVIKTRIMYEENIELVYNLVQDGNTYGLEMESKEEQRQYIYVDDIARELGKALEIMDLFANNTVFPMNALEVFDDLL